MTRMAAALIFFYMVVMGHGGCVVKHQTFGQRDQVSKLPAALLELGKYPTLPVSFRRDAISRWSFLPVAMP